MRKIKNYTREREADPVYNDELVTRFANDLMLHGKKAQALNIIYKALNIVEERKKDTELSALEIWKKALQNVTPLVEVKSRRIGGATFQVPMEIRADRKISVANKWMIKAARGRSGKAMGENLAAEILAAYNNEGGAVKKKEETHRMADANKAFSHFKF
ncbi:MAG: 30S ribosomal protein S7 [Candidatus Delongbacteria bacterium]|jgi:small subunit ribosomal protein S7|nr:30S ribosomal protein S7 [Candidatus Delongbacteria bacterium]